MPASHKGIHLRDVGRRNRASREMRRSVCRKRFLLRDPVGVPPAGTCACSPGDSGAGHLYESVVRSQLASGGPGGVRDLADAVAHHLRGRAALQGDCPEDARHVLKLTLASCRKQRNSAAAAAACLCDLPRVALTAGHVDEVVGLAEEAAAEAGDAVDPSAVAAALDDLATALGGGGQGEAAALVAAAGELLPARRCPSERRLSRGGRRSTAPRQRVGASWLYTIHFDPRRRRR